jgi:hypothetical protein
VMSDLLLRRVTEGCAGADAPDDYDVIGADGRVIGPIFKAAIPRTWNVMGGKTDGRGTRGPGLRAHARSRDAMVCQELASGDVRPRLGTHLVRPRCPNAPRNL